ncbi:MAG: hypothetical protein PUG55_05760 [Bacillales bacterium]|nr:hypothetical protein [Bacillales bacterium]
MAKSKKAKQTQDNLTEIIEKLSIQYGMELEDYPKEMPVKVQFTRFSKNRKKE